MTSVPFYVYIHIMSSRKPNSITLEDAYQAGQTCACFNLRRAARAVTQHYDEALRPIGLRATQFSMLTVIRGRGPLSIQELARHLVMDRTTLTRNLRPLRETGYVDVEPGTDRRVREISLTDKGNKVLAQAFPLWREAQNGFADHFGPENLGTLLTGLSASVDASRFD